MEETRHQLIIGLGGVGGRSIAAFRKAIVTREDDYKFAAKERGMRFEYLYIDSNDDILRTGATQRWTIYGRSVKLSRADCVMLKERGSTRSIREISQYKNISPWIGNLADHFAERTGKKNLNDGSLDSEIFGLEGAGQLRRYGRVLFALHASDIRTNLQGKIEKLTRGSDSNIDIHIFCTLGGGTGSGSIVDMVTLIQSLANDNGHTYRTYIYTFLAGSSRQAQDTGSFYENEYAALRDLNALMVSTDYHPYVVGAAKAGYYVRKGPSPIQAIYISTEKSKGNPDIEEQIDFMAKACFDTIMYGILSENPACLRAITGEDLLPDNPGEPLGKPLRSYRFSALGMKRWCVPIDKIKELLGKDYELRVLKSWKEGGRVQRDEREKVSIDFNPRGGETWKTIERYCNMAKAPLEKEREDIKEKGKREADTLTALNKMSAECAERILRDFQNNTDIRREIQGCAKKDADVLLTMLREKMDRLFEWVEGRKPWGIDDVCQYLEEYKYTIQSWERDVAGFMESPGTKYEEVLDKTMKKREREWEKIGILTIHLTNTDERMVESQFEDCVQRVDLALLPFRRDMLRILIEEARNRVSVLQSRVVLASNEIGSAMQEVNTSISALENDLTQKTNDSMSDQFAFDSAKLRKVRDGIEGLNDQHAMQMATKYSKEWKDFIGSLDNYEKNDIKALQDKLSSSFYNSSKQLHDQAVEQNKAELDNVLVTSIFESLIQKASLTPGTDFDNWEKNLGQQIANFVGKLRCSTYIAGQGLTSPQESPCTAVAFGFPERANAHAPGNFVQWLKEKFERELDTDHKSQSGRQDTFYHHSDSEIRVLYIPYWFPARFAPVVRDIFEHYKETSKKRDGRITIYFANIDDDEDNGLHAKRRPTLIEPDEDDARRFDFACKLYFKRGEVKEPIVNFDDSGISIVKSIDADGIAKYGEKYSTAEREYPSGTFSAELSSACQKAIEEMSEDERKAIFSIYTGELQRLKKEGRDPSNDPDAKEAEQVREKAKEWLGLND